MKREFYYTSADQVTKIHGIEWKPDGKVKGILQICHGMREYLDRYDGFASYLCEKGYYVVGNDHLGHGKSVIDENAYGFFHEKDGNACVIRDIRTLHKHVAKKYPGVPYFFLGHSMGSFLTRQYISLFGEQLSGAVIMGTGHNPATILSGGQMVCRLIAAFKGWHYRSKLVDFLGTGSFNKAFEPAQNSKEWLSTVREVQEKFEADPYCDFVFTVNAYYHMFEGMKTLTKGKYLKQIPRELPVFFVSGSDDPVGNFGKGVEKVYHQYKKMGMQDVELRLYPGDRHEILNEQDKEQVYEDLYQWIEKKR